MRKAWDGFKGGIWVKEIDVKNFIQLNYTPYDGNSSFLEGPTERTVSVREKMFDLLKQKNENGGVLKIDTKTIASLTTFAPGYLDKDKDIIVGFQTDEPLKRAINPFGGMRMCREACEASI